MTVDCSNKKAAVKLIGRADNCPSDGWCDTFKADGSSYRVSNLRLKVGSCLTLSTDELQAGPPKGWKAKTVGCGGSSARSKLLRPASCPGDRWCTDFEEGGNSYQAYDLSLKAGTCLSVTPGVLLTDPPKDWKTMTVGCSDTRAAVRLVGRNGACLDEWCHWVSGDGSAYEFISLPVAGVCFPGFEDSNGKGVIWPDAWSRCDDVRRIPEYETTSNLERVGKINGFEVANVRPTVWRVNRIVNRHESCAASGYYQYVSYPHDGTSSFACVTKQ